ncbi:MAG: hypothetical protein MUO78_03155 [candidate division Zixibacteria bacterium]|nr:hypothetical protein [candidate division Zixibacteria bacterium]
MKIKSNQPIHEFTCEDFPMLPGGEKLVFSFKEDRYLQNSKIISFNYQL